ncbi:MAG: hypothetical protein R6U44_08685 [Archaeoglobaceae archaeon]
MLSLTLIIPIIVSLFFSLIATNIQIEKFKEKNITATDYYKRDLRKIPTGGGIAVLFAIFLAYILIYDLGSLLKGYDMPRITSMDWKALIVIGLYGFIGALDDYVDVGRTAKILLPYTFSFPLITAIGTGIIFLPLIGTINLGLFHLLVVVPLYVLVVSNLMNMHSGFNGMASGLSAILLGVLLVKSAMQGNDNVFVLGVMLGAVIGLWWFNKYPSKIFDGNVGALAIGSAIGVGIVSGGFLVSGFIMLIPHTVNFLMYVFWRFMHKLHPEDERWEKVKFGKVREDGKLEVPNNLTLKWVLPYYFGVTEKQTVLAMYGLTVAFCIPALFIPY